MPISILPRKVPAASSPTKAPGPRWTNGFWENSISGVLTTFSMATMTAAYPLRVSI